jgi:hypothetical protein
LFSGIFIDKEVDGVGGKGSGRTTTVDVYTPGGLFQHVSIRSACFITKAFFWLEAKLPFLGLFSTAGLSGFLDLWALD